MSRDWRDISMPVDGDTPVWPGDPRFDRTSLAEFVEDGVRVSELRMSAHTGTHVDAPAHFVSSGMTIDSMPLGAMIGPCVVASIPSVRRIGPEILSEFPLAEAERLLLRTDNSERSLLSRSEFQEDFVHITAEAAAVLAGHQIRCVGIDYLSIGGGPDNEETHRILGEAGIWVIEGLDLRGVPAGEYEMVCLPLRLTGVEASPARVLLGQTDSGDETPEFIEDAIEWSSRVG